MSHHEDHLNDVLMEEMERLNLGPTGEYPEGMLTPQDQGELRMGVSAYKGKVILAFGKEIAHLGLTSEGAKDLGHLLIEQANGLSKPDFPDKPILCLDFPREKPPAFITLDDRAAQFNGTWPDIQGLLAFRPWNKKDA